MDKTGLGKRIRTARKEQNLTSDALSELCKMSPVFIRQIESSQRLPSLPSFVAICNKLGVSADYLLSDTLDTKPNDSIDAISDRLRTLSTKQAELISAVINTIIDTFKNQE